MVKHEMKNVFQVLVGGRGFSGYKGRDWQHSLAFRHNCGLLNRKDLEW